MIGIDGAEHTEYLTECPWETKINEFGRWASELYMHYQNGFLYCEGGYSNQPVGYMELMKGFSNEEGRVKSDMLEIAEAHNRHARR